MIPTSSTPTLSHAEIFWPNHLPSLRGEHGPKGTQDIGMLWAQAKGKTPIQCQFPLWILQISLIIDCSDK